MKRRTQALPASMTPLDVLAVRRHQRAGHPNRLALLASELGFGSVAALVARADELYADPRQGQEPAPRREIEDADVEDDAYLARLREN